MPAAPKSPQSKKPVVGPVGGPGAPKQKGAVRAKSGCYTCRIRRKKCDERPNGDGHCETCVRLRLQCLGFGSKRPEWLRENRNVVDMRDKIKAFLAAQGMIKGHAGTGPRGADQELPILRLDEDSNTPSSSESPPTPTLSLSPSEPPRTLQHTSSIRDQRWMPSSYGLLRSGSPYDGSPHSSHHEMTLYPDANPYNSNTLVSQWPSSRTPVAVASPAVASSFGATYTTVFPDDMYFPLDNDSTPTYNLFAFHLKPGGSSDELVTYYIANVMNLQYMLVDNSRIQSVVVPSVKLPGSSREAARLLASVHVKRSQYQSSSFTAMRDHDTKRRYEELLDVLSYEKHTEDDALAAISIISTFLFDGGAGAWAEWLGVSYNYARSVFGTSDPRETLLTCSESTRFIIKTAIWFDVLAAITTQEQPLFLRYIRELFSPLQSGVFDPAPELSMMNVMGCENVVVWLLAETSALSVWKREQQANGTLSIPDLVDRATVLEQELSQFSPSMDSLSFDSTQTEEDRALSADIFRGAARVFLRSIVSGDFPHVREIEDAVADTMTLLRTPKIPTSVVRSTVFAFFVCGALTDDPRHREAVVNHLSLNAEDLSKSTVGNSGSIKTLLEGIWRTRSENKRGQPVGWRDVLSQAQMLLV
ncbi:fungal-specific transcription factor domain-containing protein [Mycena amicta]|nr:fungal-specific transcription factor domain-containing protein [Mycena amicta]